MCIIAAKPRGVEMPSDEILMNMWLNNDDGAGLMYAAGGTVHIEKGFMKYEEFEACLKKLKKRYNLKLLPMVMHFRITTHGGTCKENCHPFPVTDSIGKLKKSSTTTHLGVAHNGIIEITPRKGISDTMEYIASQLAPLWKGVPNFYENKHLMELVKNATDSKLAIMTKNGNIYYVGDFEEDNGIMYSNSTYKRTRSWRDFSYGSWTQDIWETGNGMRDCTWVPLMWLDESKGEYVKLKSGKLDEAGEYAISRYGTVYWYSAYEDAFRHMSGASAYTAEGLALTYDEDSEMVTNEVVLFS